MSRDVLRLVLSALLLPLAVTFVIVPSQTPFLRAHSAFSQLKHGRTSRISLQPGLCMSGAGKKSQQLGPGLFDPEIPVGEGGDAPATETGKPLLTLEQCAISFNMFDLDNDGLVNKDELKQLASSMGSFWSDCRSRFRFPSPFCSMCAC
eukprot:2996063-Rhodomonas_salina.1